MLTGIEQRALERVRARCWVERKLRNRIRYIRRMRRLDPLFGMHQMGNAFARFAAYGSAVLPSPGPNSVSALQTLKAVIAQALSSS